MTSLIFRQPNRSVPHHPRRVVEGFRLPDRSPPTQNELAWLELLRAIAGDRDPPVTLAGVEALRRALKDA